MDKQTFIDEIAKKCGATKIDVSRMPKTPTGGYVENTWYDRTGPPYHDITIVNGTVLEGGCFINIITSPPLWTNPPEKTAAILVYSPLDDPQPLDDIPDDFAEIALEKLPTTPYPTVSIVSLAALALSNFLVDVPDHKKTRGVVTLALLGYVYHENYDLLMKKGEMDELGHFVGGSAVGMITPNPTIQGMLILGWEVLETYLGMIRADKTEGLVSIELFADTLKDIAVGSAGCYLASKYIK